MRWIALLRGINVGGHNVRMEELRRLFERMGFDDVGSYIASGNIAFEAKGKAAQLESSIESGLRDALGYDVPTHVRSCAELREVAALEPFSRDGRNHNIVFFKEPPSKALAETVLALGGASDDFHVRGREIHWLSQTLMSKSPVGDAFGRAIGSTGTMRNANTVRKLVVRFCNGS